MSTSKQKKIIKGWALKSSLRDSTQRITVWLDGAVDNRYIPCTITYEI